MNIQTLPTYYAPSVRAPRVEIRRQAHNLEDILPNRLLFDAIPDVIMILNEQRQIVFANRSLIDLVEAGGMQQVLGYRPGEILDCVHALEMEAGCGTSSFCRMCGATRAVLTSLEGQDDVQECRISLRNGEALDLRVWTTPLEIEDECYSFLVLKDISHEKRRQMLEHIFFHDILNSAGALGGLVDILQRVPAQEKDEVAEDISQVAERLTEEIKSQKELVAAENGDLYVETSLISTDEFLQDLASMFQGYEVYRGREILLDPEACNLVFVNDRALLHRVLTNMIKNALEACEPGQVVTLGCREENGGVLFWVHNPGYIPRDVQLQIFQRSFSTKGPGRGLGTYSIRLLGENYLDGEVSFTTSKDTGTVFQIILPLEK